jgi:hypothetical protein
MDSEFLNVNIFARTKFLNPWHPNLLANPLYIPSMQEEKFGLTFLNIIWYGSPIIICLWLGISSELINIFGTFDDNHIRKILLAKSDCSLSFGEGKLTRLFAMFLLSNYESDIS